MISGRRTFELAGRWQGDHHDGVPIFVLTHRVDEGDVPPGSAQFLTDVEDCAGQARAAAGDRAVMVHGAGAAQALLRAGLLDEMEIHLVQVLLGGGRRLFDSLGPDHIELELVRRLEARDVAHLRYRVRHRMADPTGQPRANRAKTRGRHQAWSPILWVWHAMNAE